MGIGMEYDRLSLRATFGTTTNRDSTGQPAFRTGLNLGWRF